MSAPVRPKFPRRSRFYEDMGNTGADCGDASCITCMKHFMLKLIVHVDTLTVYWKVSSISNHQNEPLYLSKVTIKYPNTHKVTFHSWQNIAYIQGLAKRRAPGCVNAAGKASQK